MDSAEFSSPFHCDPASQQLQQLDFKADGGGRIGIVARSGREPFIDPLACTYTQRPAQEYAEQDGYCIVKFSSER